MNRNWLDDGICGVDLYLMFNTNFVKKIFFLPAHVDDVSGSDLKFFFCNILVNIMKNRLDEDTAHHF